MSTNKLEPGFKFITTATWATKCYRHFGIRPITANLFGDKIEDIVEVECTVAEDQTRPRHDPKTPDADYWGWYCHERKDFSMIYPQYFLLNMCFPGGIVYDEERDQGRAYRLNVKPIK